MIESMPGHSEGKELPAGEGPYGAQAGYVDRGPRREWSDEGSMHVDLHYDPTGNDTRYDRPQKNSLLARATRRGDTKTLGIIAEGRMNDELEDR